MTATGEQETVTRREQRLEDLLIRVLRLIADRRVYALEAESMLGADHREVAEVYQRAATDSLIAYPELGGGERPELTGSGRALLAAAI